jgi:hypothetical protein
MFHRYSCPDPALPNWCGDLRNSEGKLILDANGNAQSKCVAQSASSSCPGVPNVAAKAVPQVHSVNGNVPVSLSAVGRGKDSSTILATLDIPADTVSGVAFMFSPVADSVYQEGSFAKLFSSGQLRSPLISISPNSIVDTRTGSITLALPISVPVNQCINATAFMMVRVFFDVVAYLTPTELHCDSTLCRGMQFQRPVPTILLQSRMCYLPALLFCETGSACARLL